MSVPTIFNDKSAEQLTFITDALNGNGKEEYQAVLKEFNSRPKFKTAYYAFRTKHELGYASDSEAVIHLLRMARDYMSKDEGDYDF